MPLVLNVGASCGTKEDGGNSEEEARERRLKIRWNEETRKKYKENTETGEWKEEGSIEEKWQKLKEIVQEALVKKEIVIKKKRLGLVGQELHQDEEENEKNTQEMEEKEWK